MSIVIATIKAKEIMQILKAIIAREESSIMTSIIIATIRTTLIEITEMVTTIKATKTIEETTEAMIATIN